MVRRFFLSAAMLLTAANFAGAQITTYVPPARPEAPTPAMVAAADSAARDSVAQVAVTNMKAWVDSAAGVTVPASVGDSLPPVVTTFSNGSVAPVTASDLPTVALIGAIMLALGAVLLATRQRT